MIGETRQFKGYTITSEGKVYNKRGRELKGTPNGTGYRQIKFDKLYSLHRIVYEAFNGSIGDKMVINHKDGDITNNALSNLEECTQFENIMKGKWKKYNLPQGITMVDSGTRFQYTHKRQYKFSSTNLTEVVKFKHDYERGN